MSFRPRHPLDHEPRKNVDEEVEENLDLEKDDMKAIFLAAVITFVPPLLLFLGALYLIIYLIFLR